MLWELGSLFLPCFLKDSADIGVFPYMVNRTRWNALGLGAIPVGRPRRPQPLGMLTGGSPGCSRALPARAEGVWPSVPSGPRSSQRAPEGTASGSSRLASHAPWIISIALCGSRRHPCMFGVVSAPLASCPPPTRRPHVWQSQPPQLHSRSAPYFYSLPPTAHLQVKAWSVA